MTGWVVGEWLAVLAAVLALLLAWSVSMFDALEAEFDRLAGGDWGGDIDKLHAEVTRRRVLDAKGREAVSALEAQCAADARTIAVLGAALDDASAENAGLLRVLTRQAPVKRGRA